MEATTLEVDTRDVVVDSFHDFWRAWRDGAFTFYVCKGGRNSAKSTTIAQRIILDLVELPVNALCIRKVHNTILESVYEQLKEATIQLGVAGSFSFSRRPPRLIYTPRGNFVIFRGADDPQKMKSIKTSNFPIARVWVEELTEFKLEEELQTITDSVLRATLPEGMQYKIAYSYNPPKRKQHWVNKKYESVLRPANTFVHHSTYLQNPYLSPQTLTEMDAVRLTNERKYRWVYLGEPSGGGVVPFDNLNFRRITQEEVDRFDNIRQGLDWGYAVDPAAFVRCHYDHTRRKLFIFDEIYGVKLSNRELAARMQDRKYHTTKTTADSAEPKSIAELVDLGVRCVAAVKGEGSVEYGEKWLDDLDEIVIDPTRTPDAAREFENIDYQMGPDGEPKARLEDKGNHSIDATRYACEGDMNRPGIRFLSSNGRTGK
jgi:PBSX family phage terminase large subunit